MGNNYYYFDATSTLSTKWSFTEETLKILNEGKVNTQWQELLTAQNSKFPFLQVL
jgi:hypothetical protein